MTSSTTWDSEGRGRALDGLGKVLYSLGVYVVALALLGECREIRERVLGKDHPDYAATLCNTADCLESLGRYDEALAMYV